MIRVEALSKSFTMHTQGGVVLPVFDALNLTVAGGECVVLDGPSGSGKSTLLRTLYGNYRPTGGRIMIRAEDGWIDLVAAEPRRILALRRDTLGHVSQFLRVIPRIPTLEIVAEPLRQAGRSAAASRAAAAAMLERVNLPESLWHLPPATFSGGEQQRVNVARGFVRPYPVLLLDEPTASLDDDNKAAVVALIAEAAAAGAAVVGIFHDQSVRERTATRLFRVSDHKAAA